MSDMIGRYANFRTQNNSIEDWIPDPHLRHLPRLFRPTGSARIALRQYRNEMASTKDQKKGMDTLYMQLSGA